MESTRVQIINKSPNALPAYETAGSAGLDLRAFLEAPIEMKPFERRRIPTGLYMSIPRGFEGQLRPRSGLSFKKGLTCVNAVGTIDSDYRGEVQVALINLSQETQTIEPGERIAQLILARHERAEWEAVESLDDTERGSGGFGSSGSK